MSNFVSRVLVTVVGVPVAVPRLSRRLVALRPRRVRRARRPARVLRDGSFAAAARPRRVRRRGRDLARRPPWRPRVDDRRLHAHARARVPTLRDCRDAPAGDGDDGHARCRTAWTLGLGHLVLSSATCPSTDALVFTVILVVFADDTAAYLVGRVLGRHKLAPSLSPGKTWEGFVAGTSPAIAVAFFALYEQDFTIPESIVLGAAIALAGAAVDPLRVRAQA